MPRAILAAGERFHIYNRGHNKQTIFFDEADYARMLFCLLFFQAPMPFYNISRMVSEFRKSGEFPVPKKTIAQTLNQRVVELEMFSLMPNHFHLGARAVNERGISIYMQKVEIAYTKYVNIRRKRSGYLLQGPFQSVHIATNEQFLHLSAYIHRNPRELPAWQDKEHLYPWSSYQDYAVNNRWGDLLATQAIIEQFKDKNEYKDFVDASGTKNTGSDLLDIGY